MNAKLSPQMTAALRHIETNLNSAGWCIRFYGHRTNTLAALVRRGLVEVNPDALGQLRPVAAGAETGRVLAETVARNTIAAAVEINAGSPFLPTDPAPLDCFGRPALVVIVVDRTYTVTSVDEFGAIHTAEHGTLNPGAVAELDAAVYASGLWTFARKPRAEVVEVTPITETTAESLAVLAVISAAADTERPAVPTVLPGQRVRVTGGRWRGLEVIPAAIQASGWLRFTQGGVRDGIVTRNVGPGNWEPVPYSNGLHDFAPTAGGTICVTPCLRPDGTVQPCGDPVKGAIHDPQACAAYATELTGELAEWVAQA